MTDVLRLPRWQRRALNRVLKADTNWFVRNPDRWFRLRDAVPGELACIHPPANDVMAGTRQAMLVFEIQPGIRLKHPLIVLKSLQDTEANCRELWNQISPVSAERMIEETGRCK